MEDNSHTIEQKILDSMPKTTRSRTRLLLNKIKNNKEIIHWNSRGELIYDGKAIPATQIVDLVHDVMKAKKILILMVGRFLLVGWLKLTLHTTGLDRLSLDSANENP